MRLILSLSLTITAFTSSLFNFSAIAQQRGVGLASPAAGRYHALVIGNNAYRNLRRLQTAENDARAVEALLRTRYGFRTRLLLNATRQQTLSALYAYRRELNAESSLLIYYAGHGLIDREADKAYWQPVDAGRDDNVNWISADDITTNIKAIPARHVLIVSDSCYSGTLTRGNGESLPPASEREQFVKKMAAGQSRTLMASGGDEPVVDGGGGKHSIFAVALLRGLASMDKPQFTAGELFRYHVEEAVAGRANQTPEYNPLRNSGHESGDFVFTRAGAGDKSVETAVGAPAADSSAAAAAQPDPAPTTEAPQPQGGREVELPAATDLAGTTWTGNSPAAGEFTIKFLAGGQLQYLIRVIENGERKQRAVKGTWTQSGDDVRIVIGDSYSVIQVKVSGGVMKGEGENREGIKIKWTLLKNIP